MNAILHDYQQIAADFAVTHPKCGLFLELGLGKTLITLSVLERVYDSEPGHILIIAPKAIAKATWAAEIAKWNINLPYKSLIVNEKGKKLSKQKRLEAYNQIFENHVKTVYFINREMLVDLIENCPQQKNAIVWPFQTVVIDELQSFKSPSSKRFAAIKKILPAINRFIGLTGTPTPNGIEDIWAQIYLMDNGQRLGKNITAFRSKFLHPGYVNANGVVCNWLPNNGAEEIIYSLITDIVISMKNTKLTLPPIVFIDDIVHLSIEERKLYKKFVDEAVLDFGNDTFATAANAAVMSAKLKQLASGAIYTVDENNNATGAFSVVHQVKLERLRYIRENSDDNILIAYWFKSDAQMITTYLDSLGFSYEIFDADKADTILQRWNNNEIKTLLIQPASSGFGLNFQYASHTLVWYSLPAFNLEKYLQTIGRVYRQGQTQPVYVHRILTDKTIDEHELHMLMSKDRDMKQLLDAVEYSDDQQTSLAAFANAISLSSSTPITSNDIAAAVNKTLDDMK